MSAWMVRLSSWNELSRASSEALYSCRYSSAAAVFLRAACSDAVDHARSRSQIRSTFAWPGQHTPCQTES